MPSSKLPAMQFYPGDWLRDVDLRTCSLAARGLWLDMLCLMWQAPRRGYLQQSSGNAITTEMLARAVGTGTDDVAGLLQELESAGVFSHGEHGMIYSRRMVREETERAQARERQRRSRGETPSVSRRCHGDVTPESRRVSRPSSEKSQRSSSSSSIALIPLREGEPSQVSSPAAPEPPSVALPERKSGSMRDPQQPPAEIEAADWVKACHYADLIESVEHRQAVTGRFEIVRPTGFWAFVDGLTAHGYGNPWLVVETAVAGLLKFSTPGLDRILTDLRRYPDGASPAPVSSGGFRASRLMHAFRMCSGARGPQRETMVSVGDVAAKSSRVRANVQ